MDTVFFTACKIYFRLVLSKYWIRRDITFTKKGHPWSDVAAFYVINKILFPSPKATVINLVSELFAGKNKTPALVKNPFFTDYKLIWEHM